MPCGGPSFQHSKRQAIKANREVWRILQEKFGVAINETSGCPPDRIQKMKELLTDIIWENDANSF